MKLGKHDFKKSLATYDMASAIVMVSLSLSPQNGLCSLPNLIFIFVRRDWCIIEEEMERERREEKENQTNKTE